MVSFDRDERVARQLGRLDLMLGKVMPMAAGGDLHAMATANKLITTQNLILGINQPSAPLVNVEVGPKQTSTDRIEAALNALLEQQDKTDGGETIEGLIDPLDSSSTKH